MADRPLFPVPQTVLPEALEKWAVPMLEWLLPRRKSYMPLRIWPD